MELKHAFRLIRLIEGGNQYAAAIASSNDELKVLIKEVYQHPSQAGRLSFPIRETEKFRPYMRDTLTKPEMEEEGLAEVEYQEEISPRAFIDEEPDAGD